MIRIINVKHIENYNVYIEFNDGNKGVLDFTNILEGEHREIIRDLLNMELFKTLKVKLNTICWENEVDFAPDYLYEQIENNKRKKVA